MAFWSSAKLRRNLANIVQPTLGVTVEFASVTLRVGEEVYVTPHEGIKDPGSHTKTQLRSKPNFTIPAGQFAFLLTKESVTIPFNAIGFISIKAKIKFRGLVNVSGFHVDPGYSGKLIFSVFNAGPAPIQLEEGLPLFLLWLADLDDAAIQGDARNGKENYSTIPVDLINNIPGELYSLQGLSKQIAAVSQDVKDFTREAKALRERLLTWTAIGAIVLAAILRGPLLEGLGLNSNGTNAGSQPHVNTTSPQR